MDNIDVLLKEISTETPKINPYLNNLIYEKAIAKEGKKNSFFFKKPLLLTLTSIVCIFILVFSFVNINTKLKEDQSDTDSSVTNPFVPTLSPSLQNTVLIDYHFTLFSEKYDIVTLFINNKIIIKNKKGEIFYMLVNKQFSDKFIQKTSEKLQNLEHSVVDLKDTLATKEDVSEVVAKVGPLFTADQEKTGVLASVSMAQFLLESGYATSELAVEANNCFGMKKSLSGNTWSGSTWKGEIYDKYKEERV